MTRPPPSPSCPTLPVAGSPDRIGVRRFLCIGRNYAEHVAEMGGDAEKDPPIHFTKAADALLVADGPTELRYPPGTTDLHHEVELVVVLGAGGRDLDREAAQAAVWGCAVGLDMTRRDLQHAAKAAGTPWAAAKDFDQSAVVGPVVPVDRAGDLRSGAVTLSVNGEIRQQGDLDQMIWDVPGLLVQLSRTMTLRPGDAVFTGTPSGVGPVVPGDRIEAAIEGVGTLSVVITPA